MHAELWLRGFESFGLVALTGALVLFTYKLYAATAQLAKSTEALEILTRSEIEKKKPDLQTEEVGARFYDVDGHVNLIVTALVRNVGGAATQLEFASVSSPGWGWAGPFSKPREKRLWLEPGAIIDVQVSLDVDDKHIAKMKGERLIFTVHPVIGESASNEFLLSGEPFMLTPAP